MSAFPKSIHRFKGYNIVPKSKLIWGGHVLSCEFEENVDYGDLFFHSLQELDCKEMLVSMKFTSTVAKYYFLKTLLPQLPGSIRLIESTNDLDDLNTQFYYVDTNVSPALQKCCFCKYSIPFCDDRRDIWTREKPADVSVGKKGILSNKIHGVDNTGNVCVWTSELILLHILLSRPELIACKSVIELGGGMTGLCGLGLAAQGLCSSVVITDGHPECVLNQNICIRMSKQSGAIGKHFDITSKRLLWTKGDVPSNERLDITKGGTKRFDIILASDCMFFTDFHEELVAELLGLLAAEGVVLMLQPPRGGSMDKFLALAASHFSIQVDDNYNCEISRMRQGYLASEHPDIYNEDIHYPLFVTMRRKQ